jgi:hypothetical protein
MATVTDYTGNAGLGFGANDIGFNVGNLSGVNQAIRDVQLADIDQNNRLFQQKLKDRDNLYQLLATNQVQSGKITDEDRKVFDEAERRQQDAYRSIRGANDSQGLERYYKATNDLRNITTQAQARYIGLTELEKEAASKTLPSEQKAWQSHISNQINKPFWDTVDPYQQTLKNDFEGMKTRISANGLMGGGMPATQTRDTLTTTNRNGKTTVTNTQTTAPASGKASVSRGTVTVGANGQLSPITTSTQSYDFPTFRRNAMELNVGDEAQRIYQQRWRETFEGLDPNTFQNNIELINKRLREYNAEMGLTANDEGFVTDIQYSVNPQTGQVQIAETNPDFAAKTTLASIDGPYKTTSSEFNKDIGNYLIGKDKAAQGWARIGLDREKFNREKQGDALGAMGILSELTDTINASDTPENTVIVAEDGKKDRELIVLNDANLLSQFATIDKDAKGKNRNPDQARFDKNTGEVELVYFRKDKAGKTVKNASGGNFIEDSHRLNSRTWANGVVQRTFNGKDAGNVNNILQEAISKNGGNLYDVAKKMSGQQEAVTPAQSNSSVKLKSAYKVGGKSYSKSELNKLGYSDADIEEAVRLGNIK